MKRFKAFASIILAVCLYIAASYVVGLLVNLAPEPAQTVLKGIGLIAFIVYAVQILK